MLKIYGAIVRASWQNFRLGITFWQWSVLMPCFLGFTHFTLWLDRFFFPQYRQIQIKNPIFIIGNPRSGTSFLHRQLTQTQEFTAFETWHLIFPALTARVLFKPLINYLIKSGHSTILPAHLGHELALNQIEHDEFLFFHKLDTQFVTVLSPLAYDDREHPELRLHDQQQRDRRLDSVQFLKTCLQRQLYATDSEQVISHLHFSVHRIQSLLEVFPDAKFIYLVRSPHETIPSHLSLNCSTLLYTTASKTIDSQKIDRFFQRRYRYDIELYRYFYNLQATNILPKQKVLVIQYHQLTSSLQKTCIKIFQYAGINPSHRLLELIQQTDKTQRFYKRKHRIISLDDFSLNHQQIAQDLDFIFNQYQFI